MTDIVERLNDVIPFQGKSTVAFLCHEAAAEITNLRAQVAHLQLELGRLLVNRGET